MVAGNVFNKNWNEVEFTEKKTKVTFFRFFPSSATSVHTFYRTVRCIFEPVTAASDTSRTMTRVAAFLPPPRTVSYNVSSCGFSASARRQPSLAPRGGRRSSLRDLRRSTPRPTAAPPAGRSLRQSRASLE